MHHDILILLSPFAPFPTPGSPYRNILLMSQEVQLRLGESNLPFYVRKHLSPWTCCNDGLCLLLAPLCFLFYYWNPSFLNKSIIQTHPPASSFGPNQRCWKKKRGAGDVGSLGSYHFLLAWGIKVRTSCNKQENPKTHAISELSELWLLSYAQGCSLKC